MTMKKTTAKLVTRCAAQGDVMFIRVDAIPDGAKEECGGGPVVVAHSETGHHHAIDRKKAKLYREANDPLIAYLLITAASADVIHHRPYDTHATIRLPRGAWQVRRQREYTPEGWRRVED